MILSSAPPSLFDWVVNAVEILLAIVSIAGMVYLGVKQDRMLQRIEEDVENKEKDIIPKNGHDIL